MQTVSDKRTTREGGYDGGPSACTLGIPLRKKCIFLKEKMTSNWTGIDVVDPIPPDNEHRSHAVECILIQVYQRETEIYQHDHPFGSPFQSLLTPSLGY